MIKSVRATGFPSETSTMRIVLWILVVISVRPQGVEGLECYVCSWGWSPSSDNNTSRGVDTCSPNNFQADRAKTVECPSGGCEATSYKDSKTNQTIHFYRNCMGTSTGNQLKDRCYSTEEKPNHKTSTCECVSNLCNSSVKTLPLASLLFAFTLFPFLRVQINR